MTKLHEVEKKLPESQNQGSRGYLLHGDAGEVPFALRHGKGLWQDNLQILLQK